MGKYNTLKQHKQLVGFRGGNRDGEEGQGLEALGIRPLCEDNQYHVLLIKWKLFQAVLT